MTLDRVRQIDVEADLNVWLDYARAKQLHGAVISYLTVKEDRFYMVQRKEDALCIRSGKPRCRKLPGHFFEAMIK